MKTDSYFEIEKARFEKILADANLKYKNPTTAFNIVVWNSLIHVSSELQKIKTAPLLWCFKCLDDTLSKPSGECEICNLSRPRERCIAWP
jgi:hypothetical protein